MSQNFCRNCNTEVNQIAKYCHECGEKITFQCNCGYKLSGTEKFCPECGKKLIREQADLMSVPGQLKEQLQEQIKGKINDPGGAMNNASSKSFDNIIGKPGETVIDIDGNKYKTVKIGDQLWMAENLRVSRYRNGEAIHHAKDADWYELTSGAWVHYNNDESYDSVYGKLYNWYAVNDPRNIAPKGWHIPTREEWRKLINYLGGEKVAGPKIASPDNEFWEDLNKSGTNESGFTGLPGGEQDGFDSYYMGEEGYWWSSTEKKDKQNAWGVKLGIQYSSKYIYVDEFNTLKSIGKSVRCIGE